MPGNCSAGHWKNTRDRPDVLVLALPRGGVPVAAEVAKRLRAPLDILVVRKLGVPGWEELAMGAIASGGIRVLNEEVVRGSKIDNETIERTAAAELMELHRREQSYRGRTDPPDAKGRTVILVDDGIATGSTVAAAVRALRQLDPAAIVIGVPAAAADACDRLSPLVDELVALVRPIYFHSVGRWYENFDQTTDAEVKLLMAEVEAAEPARRSGP